MRRSRKGFKSAKKTAVSVYDFCKPKFEQWGSFVMIHIKPLSINKAFQGRRFKTKDYEAYERCLSRMSLPNIKIPEGKLEIHLQFGFSNKASDWDNPVKLFQDFLQKRYGFNDKKIYKAVVEKFDVDKGKDYIKFGIYEYK